MPESEYFDGKKFPAVKKIVDDAGNTMDLTAIYDVIRDVTVVDSSGGGTAQTANCTLVPADSLILAIYAEVLVAMDGDTTKTLEVGVSGNIDNYVDTTDFDPAGSVGDQACNIGGTTNDKKTAEWVAAATQIIATWTNAASAGAGSTRVTVVYLPLA